MEISSLEADPCFLVDGDCHSLDAGGRKEYGKDMGCFIYFLGAISTRPFDIIREELSSWEPWKVVLSVALILIICSFVHKSNH